MTQFEEDEQAAENYLKELNKIGIKPLEGNPLDVTIKTTGRGVEVKRMVELGPTHIKVTGDPYATFAKGPNDIPL